jgi:hypothetical protein
MSKLEIDTRALRVVPNGDKSDTKTRKAEAAVMRMEIGGDNCGMIGRWWSKGPAIRWGEYVTKSVYRMILALYPSRR